MSNINKYIITIILLLLKIYLVFPQDVSFSQFQTNLLYLNPAYSGYEKCPELSVNYRTQWLSSAVNYTTYYVSYDQYVDVLQGGAGIMFMNDVAGDFTNLNISGLYSYFLNFSRKYSFKAGFQCGFNQKSMDINNAKFGDKTEIISNTPVKYYFDFATGFILSDKKSHIGIAIHHMNEPNQSLSKEKSREYTLPVKYTIHFETLILKNSIRFKNGELLFSPSALFQIQRRYSYLKYGGYLKINNLISGIWINQTLKPQINGLIFLIGINTDNYRISYSYDFSILQFSMPNMTTHELLFSYKFNCKKKKQKNKTIKCSSF
ncbi:MAG: PorP/SprF family type IX secretion system membrane protein [Bacteroidales bacterium]|nr:PorP/SprF family type IX secretion system membrane protein [Bacteroidales bacterium]